MYKLYIKIDETLFIRRKANFVNWGMYVIQNYYPGCRCKKSADTPIIILSHPRNQRHQFRGRV